MKIYLGIDYGEKRIGLALGNDETKMASPIGVVGTIDEVFGVAKDEMVDEIVLGMPLHKTHENGKGMMQDRTREFMEKLKAELDLPIHIFDERFSSRAADALSGDKKTKAARDAVAAMLILQSFLDGKVV
jgi:putative holliday junction resolvase